MKKSTILYYDLDSETAVRFKKRHDNNPRLSVEEFSNISSILSRIDEHDKKPIDLILIDYFSAHPWKKSSEVEIQPYKTQITDKVENIDELIMDFQQYKDHLNNEIDKVMLREGVNAAETLFEYLDHKGIDDIQLGMYSMLGRRLISSKEASRLQSKGVMWVWKSKEKLVKENEEQTGQENIAANSEFDSIHSAIMARRQRGSKVSGVVNDLWVSLGIQLLTLLSLWGSLIYHLYVADLSLRGLDLLGYLSAFFVITVPCLGLYKTIKQIKALARKNFT
ncbi:hypothetical protein HYO49_22390 [Vibrio parahaemolyticus]|nr:hypothetical protein [Vibrio parahaemolyticus]